jgi:hypothetical protein
MLRFEGHLGNILEYKCKVNMWTVYLFHFLFYFIGGIVNILMYKLYNQFFSYIYIVVNLRSNMLNKSKLGWELFENLIIILQQMEIKFQLS